jgi:hypothetical protein
MILFLRLPRTLKEDEVLHLFHLLLEEHPEQLLYGDPDLEDVITII